MLAKGLSCRPVSTILPFRRRSEREPDLQVHAMSDLRYIRETMERAGSLTTFPGWGLVLVGVTALVAAAVATFARAPEQWLGIWSAEALLSMAIGAAAMARKARRAGMPMLNEPGRRFVLSFSLPIVVGAVLTGVLFRHGIVGALPGIWLLLYGTAVATGGAFSVPIVPRMGYAFMLIGVLALFFPPSWGNVFMAGAFGGLHMVFGWVIARRYGG